jgi:hypothetical protein
MASMLWTGIARARRALARCVLEQHTVDGVLERLATALGAELVVRLAPRPAAGTAGTSPR